MSMSLSEHDLETRRKYQAEHERISADADAFNRVAYQYGKTSFSIDPEWFKGKTALDGGCGNIGGMLMKLHDLGVSHATGIDIGSEWIAPLTANLKRHGCPDAFATLRPGSIEAMPCEDNAFDFVSINGVLIHLETMATIERAFAEGARVTKPGGWYFTSYGPCLGVMQGYVMPALRRAYAEMPEFRNLIDNISPKIVNGVIDKVVADTEKHTGEKLDGGMLRILFGEDWCVFLQNYIAAPTWWSNECTPEYVEGLYRANGFTNIRRLLPSFHPRKDVRKFFAPLHCDLDDPISKIMYGHGYVQYIAQKPA